MQKVKTRFAPSPTGYLHIGGVRTALFCWLFTQKHQGEFLLRIEDTDTKRNVDEASQLIMNAMNWLGLTPSTEVIFQSNRHSIYLSYLEKLLADKKAYVCHCTKERLDELRNHALKEKKQPKYDGYCADKNYALEKASVVRLKVNQQGSSQFEDATHGRLEIKNSGLDDLIIWRDNSPTYNFSVVVDDALMQISHVIRGDDHINNTFRQLSIFKALGFKLPIFSHLPMILDIDGSRLSKRNQASNVLDYQKEGYLPEAVLNYLFRLGFSDGDKEIFSLREMVKVFDLAKINTSAASLNPKKLDWLNQQYLSQTENSKLFDLIEKDLIVLNEDLSKTQFKEKSLKVIAMQKTRAKTLKELAEYSCIFYQNESVIYDEKQKAKFTSQITKQNLIDAIKELSSLNSFNQENIHHAIQKIVDVYFNSQFGKFARPLRFILTGSTPSGDLAEVMELIGKNEVMIRLENFKPYLNSDSSLI